MSFSSRRASFDCPLFIPKAVFKIRLTVKNVAFSGFDYDTCLNETKGVTVRVLLEEVYLKACERREWNWVNLN